ncbi:restriction endonuclease subunit S [Wohlfahrtiimonas sp. G9077]|uniref:restriction endonuclease subunit S n=1 Tax=Wohlfahrtiimonas sp. G9077 TaxID=1980118 RepID=UPI000B998C09|nr:restriction endonuclease subunit S [Wohlfahrtiimonas sp. G9077]OYQ73921.1 hypothetical protein B9T20_06045 [Wohlfahrtiimonas sp. G9077]
MSDWQSEKLGNVVKIINGFAFKSQNFLSEEVSGALPVLKIKNVANGDVNLKDVQYHLHDVKFNTVLAIKDDLLIAMTGNHPHAEAQVVGAVSLLKLNIKALINQRVAKIESLDGLSNQKFIYYLLKDKKMAHYIASQSSGSANQANISKSALENIEISLPPLPEQKAIADVLSALDDKIDLLQRQNETLEKMAETLFRQWFIEEAKEDWELCSFEKWISGTKGGDWGKEVPVDDFTKAVYCLRGTDIASLQKNMSVNAPLRFIKEKKFFSIEPDNGDIVIEISGGTETQSTGRSYYITEGVRKLFTQPIIFSNFCRLITVRNSEYSYFIYLYLKFLYDTDEFFALENGSSGIKNLNYKAVLFEQKFLMPTVEKVLDFHELVCSNFIKIDENRIQIQTLQNLRDTLLPKLMSGEVRVKLD